VIRNGRFSIGVLNQIDGFVYVMGTFWKRDRLEAREARPRLPDSHPAVIGDKENALSSERCNLFTANITEFLLVLDRNELLKFHRVDEPVSRGLIVDGKQPHTTPVIVETKTGTPYSVDSWTKAYGQSPDIMTISEWKSKD